MQVALAAFCSYLGPVYGAEVCELSGNVYFAQFLLVWLFDGCYAWYRWVAWYGTFYVCPGMRVSQMGEPAKQSPGHKKRINRT